MADYRPLIEHLVSSLPERDAAARASAYDRARAALENQFDDDPEAVERLNAERLALADAITDVEAELSAEDLPPAEPFKERPVRHEDMVAAPPQPEPTLDMWQRANAARDRSTRGTTQARRWSAAEVAATVCALCALMVAFGAAEWGLSHRHEHTAVAAEGEADGAVDMSVAAVPAPVGITESSEAEAAPLSLVAQRAALLVDAPQESQRLTVYAGHVTWRLVHPEPVPDRAAPVRVEADAEFPKAGLRVEVLFDKNAASELSASHTAQVRFIRRIGNPLGGIDRIGLPEMRDADAPIGDPLAGSQAKVTDDIFLIGLAGADHEAANLRLIRSRPWLDLPIMLQGHKEAKLTLEKGATGDAVWAEALAAWR